MNKYNAKKISGTGWFGLVIQLTNSDDFDLLKLLRVNQINTHFFWKVLQEVIGKIETQYYFINQKYFSKNKKIKI